MSILASFAVLLSQADAGYGHYYCEDNARWDNSYQAMAVTRFEVGYANERKNELRLSWSPVPTESPLATVEWAGLPLETESLPPPDKLEFGIRLPNRLKGGTILLIPAEGELVQVPVKKPAVTYRKYGKMLWVQIADAAQRGRLTQRGGGWRFAAISSEGRVAAQGAVDLPDRSGMAIRYRPLAQGLRDKAAAYEKACIFEPVTETR
jgi:hypothetical protein